MELKLCFVLSEVRRFSKGPLGLLFSSLGPKDSFNVHNGILAIYCFKLNRDMLSNKIEIKHFSKNCHKNG